MMTSKSNLIKAKEVCIQNTLSSRTALGQPAFRPSASREQRYLAYKKEVCSVCTKYIIIGNSVSVCGHCDLIFHAKCAKRAKFKLFHYKQYCLSCITTNDIIRYNTFHDLLENQDYRFFENEPTEYIQSIQELPETLENCKSYSKSQFNE